MTIEVHMMNEREARVITEQIRISAHNYTEARTKLMERVQEAKDGNAHLVLGYASWTAYLSEVLGEEPMRLARDERQDMVRMLANEGMSSRAIAPIVGASPAQVKRDVRGGSFEPPAPENVDTSTGEIHDEPKPVTGMDGKEYKRPEPKPGPGPSEPKRPPLPEQIFNAIYDLGKVIDRLERLTNDDRFSRAKEQVALKHESDLKRHQDALQSIISKLTS